MLPPLIVVPICSHDPVDDVERAPVPEGSVPPHNSCKDGLQRTRDCTRSFPCSLVIQAIGDVWASTLGDFSRRADVCDSRGRRSGGVFNAMVPLTGTRDGETDVTAPVTEFRVSGCCPNHDSSGFAIVPEFRNREPAFRASQKASPQLEVRKRLIG